LQVAVEVVSSLLVVEAFSPPSVAVEAAAIEPSEIVPETVIPVVVRPELQVTPSAFSWSALTA